MEQKTNKTTDTFILSQDGETLRFEGNEKACYKDWESESKMYETETFFDWCKNSYPIVPTSQESKKELATNSIEGDFGEDFYNLMQSYRVAPMDNQLSVIKAYEDVKKWITDRNTYLLEQNKKLIEALDICTQLFDAIEEQMPDSPLLGHYAFQMTRNTAKAHLTVNSSK